MSQRTMDEDDRSAGTHEDWREALVDKELERRWRKGRPRRIAVKVLGWASIIGALAGVVHIANSEGARSAMLQWGTMSIVGGGR